MFNVFVIALREGVEVSIILAIMLSYLRQLDELNASRKVWLGAGLAILISILSAVGIFLILGTTEIEGFQAILEGSLKILAVIILTWMTLWMKRQGGNLGSELKRQVKEALGSGSAWTLAFLAFISVIREGIETVLFIVGTAQETTAAGTFMGSLLGFLLAGIIGYIIYRGTYRIPLKAFFTVMSVLLIFIGAGLLSGGIHEFQELNIFPEGISPLWSTKGVLSEESAFGSLLKAIFGYQDSPNLVQVLAYWGYLAGALYAYFKPEVNR